MALRYGVDGGNITNSNVPYRLMNACGGYLSRYGSYSTAQISAAMSAICSAATTATVG